MNVAITQPSIEVKVNPLGNAILRTLLYFDIFNYPLTLREIKTFSGQPVASLDELDEEINSLRQAGLIFQFDKFFSVQNDLTIINRRVKGNSEAERNIPMAQKRANLIGKFPFVKSVMVSGSLSKGYMDEKSDLDFFVITDPYRLWITRTLFVLHRKIFVSRERYKEFCINYLITSNQMEIEEKNIFTATELATLIPLCGHDIHNQLMCANRWVQKYLPNFEIQENQTGQRLDSSYLKSVVEKLSSFLFAKQLDGFLMRLTIRVFRRKYGKQFVSSDFSLAFKSKPHVSKAHLGNHQTRVLVRLAEKLEEFESRFSGTTNNA